MKFSQVIGQEDIKQQLKSMVHKDRLPHALLLCGPGGSGKMALGLSLASYLLCASRTEEDSCGVCPQCSMINSLAHPDLHFSFPVIKPQASSSDRKMVSDDFISEWREMLLQSPYFTMDNWLKKMKASNQQAIMYVSESAEILRKLSIKSSQGRYKVSLIYLPERMNDECANKLLKIIEEPPQKTIFIMVSEKPEEILETIRSRSQRIDVPPINTKDIENALKERRGIDPDSARRISRSSLGSWTQALEDLMADGERSMFFDMFKQLMRLCYSRKIKDLKKWAEEASSFGRERQNRMLSYFLKLLRENFMYNFKNPDIVYLSSEEEEFAQRFSPFINEVNIIEISSLMSQAMNDIARNANAKIVFFDLSAHIIVELKKKP
ncbi:MAG: DNA polymerase III subunit delta [Prevotella sp.]|nr:DNA polymerase III subunit delta [Prevotella sp.]